MYLNPKCGAFVCEVSVGPWLGFAPSLGFGAAFCAGAGRVGEGRVRGKAPL